MLASSSGLAPPPFAFASMHTSIGIVVLLAAAGIVLLAERPPFFDRGDVESSSEAEPRRLKIVEGLDVPESARYDAELDHYYVSNVTGHPTREDNSGFISVMDPDGGISQLRFIAGGRDGVTLHAPKGMALVGDTLWVTDINVLRGFHRRTGRSLAVVDLRPHNAGFLNDVAVGPDGSLYISDTGFRVDSLGRMRHAGPDQVFRLQGPDRVTVAVQSDSLRAPNGVFWDRRGDRLLIGSFNGRSVLAWHPDRGLSVAATGPGGYDGIEATRSGEILLSSQDGRSVVVLRGDTLVTLIPGIEDMGDIGIDTRRDRLAIPRLDTNLLELWELGTATAAPGARASRSRAERR